MELIKKEGYSFFIASIAEAKETILKTFNTLKPFEDKIIKFERDAAPDFLNQLVKLSDIKITTLINDITEGKKDFTAEVEILYIVSFKLFNIFTILSDLNDDEFLALVDDKLNCFDDLLYYLLFCLPEDPLTGKMKLYLYS